jgi:hypothetical protein
MKSLHIDDLLCFRSDNCRKSSFFSLRLSRCIRILSLTTSRHSFIFIRSAGPVVASSLASAPVGKSNRGFLPVKEISRATPSAQKEVRFAQYPAREAPFLSNPKVSTGRLVWQAAFGAPNVGKIPAVRDYGFDSFGVSTRKGSACSASPWDELYSSTICFAVAVTFLFSW